MQSDRRQFLKGSFAMAASTALGGKALPKVLGPYLRNSSATKRFIVLGMDGMDPNLVRQFVQEGLLPTFAKLLPKVHFGSLRTTMPPQSPVAWASFINGTNPGGHGIFDFIHRDPAAFVPYLSTSRTFDSTSSLKIGKWNLPLGSAHLELMRKGVPFWNYLEQQDIPTVVHQIPSNFPVVDGPTKAISGMGTPDLLGTYGTFTLFSEGFVENADSFTGGNVVRLRVADHKAKGPIVGPNNAFRTDSQITSAEVSFVRDPEQPLLKISVQEQTVLLRQGEWSDWVPLKFDYVPGVVSAAGMVRFYAKGVHPQIKVYCSPVNVDPMDPALPIGSPAGHSQDIAKAIGRFYTQGLPADTKALSHKVLDDEEFFAQAKLILEESMRSMEYGLKNFHEGVFFFYFSSIDQCSHMLMRAMDVNHPQYSPNASPEIKNAIRYLYKRMDDALAEAMRHVDSSTAIVALSDHGFSTFYREFHLGTWLVQQGYTVLTDPSKIEESNFFDYVDWTKTKAYALGFNGLYINRSGREKNGQISEAEASSIKAEIIARLPLVRDPRDGRSVVAAAYDSDQIYSGPFKELAPDIVVGYNAGFRVSDESVLGRFGHGIVGNRTDKWSADHCIDHNVVPGMLLMNRECKHERPAIWDLAPTILQAFGITPPAHMNGHNLI